MQTVFVLSGPLFVLQQEGKLEPEEFTSRLYKELKSSPQPYLVPFLKVRRAQLALHEPSISSSPGFNGRPSALPTASHCERMD